VIEVTDLAALAAYEAQMFPAASAPVPAVPVLSASDFEVEERWGSAGENFRALEKTTGAEVIVQRISQEKSDADFQQEIQRIPAVAHPVFWSLTGYDTGRR
jgi:hypothetical protein